MNSNEVKVGTANEIIKYSETIKKLPKTLVITNKFIKTWKYTTLPVAKKEMVTLGKPSYWDLDLWEIRLSR